MDFFTQQDRARRQTRTLVVLFIAAVIAIIVAVDLVVLFLVAANSVDSATGAPAAFSLHEHTGLLALTSLVTAAFITLASTFRIASLSAGGGKVARSLGGTLITPDTPDPLRKRLHNVVEEIAIASGVPVPEVYVLEQEAGLNAFAAGFAPGDAAIAVTRGSLETFSRDELQGVIAHEFSHVLNGDMRLNMRLMGILFGILAISVIGRTILRSMRYSRFSSRSSNRGGGMGAVIAVGAALTVIGFVGLLFARMIKAGVSRQREYLADASAVQFTRQTQGIANALKKIGYGATSALEETDVEEVSHMLFANGLRRFSSLYATHPPVEARIRALEPNFDPDVYVSELHRKAAADEQTLAQQESDAAPTEARARLDQLLKSLLILTPAAISGSIGNAGEAHIQHAADVRRLIPPTIREAAHSASGAMLLVPALLLDRDDAIREQQLALLAPAFNQEQLSRIRELYDAAQLPEAQFRLPILDMAFPALRQRPREQLSQLLAQVRQLIAANGQVNTFEYLLSRVLMSHLRDAGHPQQAGGSKRRVRLSNSVAELHTLFSVVAWLGHPANGAAARDAYQAGMLALLTSAADWPPYQAPGQWTQQLDQALSQLDNLSMLLKEELIKALSGTISHDGKVTLSEAELLRAICAILHCPLPPLLPERVS
ncbi:MAG: M48 family metallopeptidase [Thiogranum sp.]|nr:M48 family metallopeptidase [Thiogranum sp.]